MSPQVSSRQTARQAPPGRPPPRAPPLPPPAPPLQPRQRQKERSVLKNVCLTFCFHVMSILFGVALALLLGLTLCGAGLVLLCICSGSSRSVRVLVASLWRAELWINSLGVDPAKRANAVADQAQSPDGMTRTGSSTASTSRSSSAPSNGSFRSSATSLPPRTHQYSSPASAHRGREVTGSVMVLSLLYFLLFKWMFNIIFAAIPLVFWNIAIAQFVPENSDLAANLPIAGGTTAKSLVGIAVGFLAHQVSVTSAAAMVFVSEKMASFLFEEARRAEDPAYAPLLHWNAATQHELPTHTFQYNSMLNAQSAFDARPFDERRPPMASTQSLPVAYQVRYDSRGDEQQQSSMRRDESSSSSRGSARPERDSAAHASAAASSRPANSFVPPMPPMPPMPFLPYPPPPPSFNAGPNRTEASYRGHVDERDVDCCLFKVRISRTNDSGGGNDDSSRDGGRGGSDLRESSSFSSRGGRGGGRGGGGRGGGGRVGLRGLDFRDMQQFHDTEALFPSVFDPRTRGPFDPFALDPRLAARQHMQNHMFQQHLSGQAHARHALHHPHHPHHPHPHHHGDGVSTETKRNWAKWLALTRDRGMCHALKRTQSFDSLCVSASDDYTSLPPHMRMYEVLDLSPSAPPLHPGQASFGSRSDRLSRTSAQVPFARLADDDDNLSVDRRNDPFYSSLPPPTAAAALRMRKSNSDEGRYTERTEFADHMAAQARRQLDQVVRQREQVERQREQHLQQQQQQQRLDPEPPTHSLPLLSTGADAPMSMSPTSYMRERAVYAKDRDFYHDGIAQAAQDGIEQAKMEEKQLAAQDSDRRPTSITTNTTAAVSSTTMTTAIATPPSAPRAISRRPVTSGENATRIITVPVTDTTHVPRGSDSRRISFTGPYQAGVTSDAIDLQIRGQFGSLPRTFEDGSYLASFGAPGQSSSETITTLNDAPLFRGLESDPQYNVFSPSSAGNGSFLDTGGGVDTYDSFSPAYAAHDLDDTGDDGDDGFPTDQLPQVYRSIRYTGPPASARFAAFNDDVSGRRDKVHFNAFAPPSVAPSPKPFHYTVWAFLLNQRSEMRERAETFDPTGRKLSVDTKLDIRRGALVHVTLETPEGFRIRNGATQGFSWEGKVCNATFDVECTRSAGFGSVLFKATIIVGTEVAVLRSYVSVSEKALDPVDLEAQMLESKLEVLEKTFEEIPYQSLEIKELVGTGHFGDAYRATYKGQDVVVKTIRASEFGDTSDQIVQEFQHEAAVLNMFGHHPCVVPFVGASTDIRFPLSVVTEYLPFGSLEDNLRRQSAGTDAFTLRQKTVMLKDAAAGLLNIHEGGFIHRDIAARNCLVDDNLRIKICDFGLCRRVSATGTTLLKNGVGPVKYMAPESLLPPHLFSYESDSYMFGVLMWETYTMSSPFASLSPLEAVLKVMNGERLAVPKDLPETLQSLMETCFHDSPAQRPSMVEILSTLDDVASAAQVCDKTAVNAVAAASASLSSSIELRPGRSSVFV